MSWRRFLRRQQRDEELAHEIESYLGHEIDEGLARGMTQEQARRAALRKFGNTTRVRDVVYEMHTLNAMDTFLRDIRYGMRQLRLNPGFCFTAILSLALGIGANTAIFQVLNAVRLRSLPVKNPQELAEVKIEGGNHGWGVNPGWPNEATYPLWEQIRDHEQAFSGIFAWGVGESELGEREQKRKVQSLWVTGAAFPTLGVTPYRRRLLTEADDRPRCDKSAV